MIKKAGTLLGAVLYLYIYDDDVEVVARAKQYKLSRPVFAHSAVLFVFIVFNRLLICVR